MPCAAAAVATSSISILRCEPSGAFTKERRLDRRFPLGLLTDAGLPLKVRAVAGNTAGTLRTPPRIEAFMTVGGWIGQVAG